VRAPAVILVVAALMLAAAVAAVAVARDPEPDAIPWVEEPLGAGDGRPERVNVPPIPRGARFCGKDDVRVTTGEPQPAGSIYTGFGVAVRNVSKRTCVIRGLPSFEILSNDGGPIRVEPTRGSGPEELGYPAASPGFGLGPGKTAAAAVITAEDCSSPRIARGSVAVRVGWARLVRLELPTCASGVTVHLDAFQPPELPEPPPVPWRSLRASLDAPSTARRGTTLHYRVTLENHSERPFTFPYCPSYASGTDGGDGGGNGFLNCRPAGRLEPGERATFEMWTRLSKHLRPGRHTLDWYLHGDLLHARHARAAIRIERGG
jgi:Protein of unknown function (DUF4232)